VRKGCLCYKYLRRISANAVGFSPRSRADSISVAQACGVSREVSTTKLLHDFLKRPAERSFAETAAAVENANRA
jgi:hypothetical protein